MISVVLVEPETAGNVGAVARLMHNFGVSRLVLVRPRCDHLSKEALDRAKHARHLLEGAVVHSSDGFPDFDYKIATTSQLGKDYHILRSPIKSSQLGELLKDKEGSIGLIFGPEGPGLSNEQIKECDFVVTIPSSHENPVLNLSHAVGILLYEVFRHEEEYVGSHIRPIRQEQKERLEVMLEEVLQELDMEDFQRETQRRLWKHIIGRSFLSSREAVALMGFLAQVKKRF